MELTLQNKHWSVGQSEDNSLKFELLDSAVPDLADGQVLIQSSFSSINFRDLLAYKGNIGVIRRFPYCPGVDLSGSIVKSKSSKFESGDVVGVWAASTNSLKPGGWSKYVIVNENDICKIPSSWDLKSFAAIGTAGLAASLGLVSIHHSLNCSSGEGKNIIISGASGGVGSIGIILASYFDWSISSISSASDQKKQLLKKLGSNEVIDVESFVSNIKPNLLRAEYDGFIDTIGGDVLVSGLKRLKFGGAAASAGLVRSQSIDNLTVIPFLMRGISITGTGAEIASEWRKEIASQYIDKIINDKKISEITTTISFEDVSKYLKDWEKEKNLGRYVIAF
jgi:acrylyl-CoA reductase (NADPH)